MCVIPTGLRWRQEKKVLAQLESLAARLQLTSPSTNMGPFNNTIGSNINIYDDGTNESLRGSKKMRNGIGSRRPSDYGVDNPGFVQQENPVDIAQYSHYGSQNEFDASIFGLSPSHYIGPPIPNNLGNLPLLKDRNFILTYFHTTYLPFS